MKKIRTVRAAIKELKAEDPDCDISEFCLRALIKNGEIPVRKSGNTNLIALDDVIAYFDMTTKLQ